MTPLNPDVDRALQLRAIHLNDLDTLERYDDPAPSDVDLTDIAVLLDQALRLLNAPGAKIPAGLDATAAIEAIDFRLLSVMDQLSSIIDLQKILQERRIAESQAE